MFGKVLNTPLRWCILCNLKGVFLIKSLTFQLSILLLFYLCIGNFLRKLAKIATTKIYYIKFHVKTIFR